MNDLKISIKIDVLLDAAKTKLKEIQDTLKNLGGSAGDHLNLTSNADALKLQLQELKNQLNLLNSGGGVNLSSNADALKNQIKDLERELANLGSRSGNINLGGGQLSAEAQRIGNATQQARQSLDELGRSGLGLRSVLQGLVGAFSLYALYEMGKKLIEVADNMKLIDGRLRVATAANVSAGEAIKGHELAYKALLDISMRTGTSFEANATLFARINVPMQQMGGSVKNTLAFTEMLSKSLVISGAGAGETASVIRQMSQAMASGVLRGDEFNSIMENGGRVAQALADGLHTNIGALRAMAEAGNLTTQTVMPALMSQAEKINAEYAQMPMTVGRSFERIKTAFGQYITEVDKGDGVIDGLAQSFDGVAKNITPIVDGLVTVGKILLTVWSIQAVKSIAGYVTAQGNAVLATRELIATEQLHGDALVINAERTLLATNARRAEIQADLAAAAARLRLAQTEVAAAEVEVAATTGTTAHGNAVYRLNVALQEKATITAEVSALGQAQAAITVEQTAATDALTAAQEANNVSMWASIKAMGAAGIAMGLLNAAMAAFVGWEIGKWLNGFVEVKNVAVSTVAVLHKMVETLAMFYEVAKAGLTGGSISKVMDDYHATMKAIDDTRDSAIAYNNRLNELGISSDEYSDKQMNMKSATEIFNEKMRVHTENLNNGTMSLKDYTAALAKLHDEMKNATPATAFDKELASVQDRIDKNKLSERDYYEKEIRGKGITDQAQIDSLLAKFDEAKLTEQGKKAADSFANPLDEKLSAAAKKFGYSFNEVNAKFAEAGAKYGVDPNLLKAQAFQESKFNPKVSSSAGAIGFSQFMPETAQRFGLTDRTNPVESIEAQAKYMGLLLQKFNGRVDLALAGYNAGENIKSLESGQVPQIKETQDYVKKILSSVDPELAAQFESNQRLQQNTQNAGFSQAKSGIDLALKQAQFESKQTIDNLKLLKEQGKMGADEYYAALTKAQSAGIDSSIKAIEAKLAVATKQYEAQKLTSAPEDLPTVEADYKNNTAQLKQELTQLNTELMAIKRANNADLLKETNVAKQEQIDIEEKAALERLSIAETEAQQQLDLGNISNGTFLEKQKEFESQRYQIALKAAQARRALLDENDATGKAKALGQETALQNKHAADLKAINHKMAMDSQSSFTSAFAPIKSAFGSTIQGILQGTTTLKQGMKNAFQSIALSYAQSLMNMAIDDSAHWLWKKLGFAATEAEIIATKGASEATQTVITETECTTRNVIEATSAQTSKAVDATTSKSKITSKAASAAAGAYDALVGTPFIGPVIAPIAAAAAFVGVMAFGGMVSSSKGGEWDVPEDRLNFVHKNETILPATIAQPMREFFAAGSMQGLGLPQQATALNGNAGAGLAMTAASALSAQQSIMQTQQKQQRQSSGGTVVINTKGGDFVHKDDIAKVLANDNRNFRFKK